MKNYGKGHDKAIQMIALIEENGNGFGIHSGSLRIISPVLSLNETPRPGIQKKRPSKAVLEVQCAR